MHITTLHIVKQSQICLYPFTYSRECTIYLQPHKTKTNSKSCFGNSPYKEGDFI